MRIDHLAIWCRDLEKLRSFYEQYLGATAGARYHNKTKDFQSYFHFAISVGSKDVVDGLTTQLRTDGFAIVGEPRTTGDGYYESVVLDPEGNRIEITV